MAKKALIITEVFYPEDFIINDLVKDWLADGNELEILTRNPSYPFGKVLKGYKNKIYCKGEFHGSKVHRILVIPGYQKSVLKKILNYINYAFLSFWFLLFKGKQYNKIFIYQTGPLTNAFSAVLLKSIYKFKITIWSQDLWPETIYAYGLKQTKLTHFFLTQLVRFIYKRCDNILISCKGFESKINKLLRKPKTITWVPNWAIINKKGTNKNLLNKGFNFTFAGNIGKVQNLENIIRAFKKISSHHPNAYLNIIGDGSNLIELMRLSKTEKIKNINFTGRKPLVEMPDYFEESDVLLISLVDTPLYEIMIPSKFQTYLTANKPIYSVMKGEVEELVSQNKLGYTAHPSQISEIEKGFTAFINLSEDALSSFSKNAQQLLDNNFNEDKIKKKLNLIFWNETGE